MKHNETWFNKVIYAFNILLVVLTFFAYILPFLAPKLFQFLSVLSLFLPVFIFLNVLFFGFWLLQFKKKMLLSGLVLLLGITFINKLYHFSSPSFKQEKTDIKIMSYNVRLFNLYEWLPKTDVPEQISTFVKQKNPNILCLQEFSPVETIDFSSYKYKYIATKGKKNKYGQAIFSTYKIVDKGTIDFPDTSNNVIFVDIKIKNDTFRVYSMHLQSIKITQDIHENIDENKSKLLFKRIGKAFAKQQQQAELIKKHMDSCLYPVILCGDMNNSAFSYVYRTLKGNLNDTFEEAGAGFGKTYHYKYYPARIDYIFVDKKFTTKSFINFDRFFYSDHYPILATLNLEKQE